ncbi:putative Ars binding protein 1, partial [Globisporangium splendens]
MGGKRRVGSGNDAAALGTAPRSTAASNAATGGGAASSSGRGGANYNGNLTNYQRKIICEFYHKNGGVMSQKDLAQWTKHEFNLKKTPAQSTISGILRRQHEFVNMSSLELGIKKRRVVQHPLLDQALANWVIQCAHRGITVQGDMTKEKAKHFAKMLEIPEDEQPEFSNGWLHSFQLRHNFSFRKFNADNNSNNNSGNALENKKILHFTTMEALVNETDKYELSNIFAMEETGVLYTLPPTQNAVEEDPMRAKKRFVVALAANADGSEKLQPLFVSHHEHPKCFKKKTAEQHGFHYFWNHKAWMTGVIFSRWIQRLDFAMATQKRRILLFINDAPSHVVSHLELKNVVVFILPTGASQMLNPITANLVSTFKKRYRRHHVRYAIDKAEEGKKFLFDVDILQAMRWANASWEEITRETIERSWAATHTIPDRVPMRHDLEDHEFTFLETELSHLFLFLRLQDVLPLSEYLNDEEKSENSLHEEFFEVVQNTDEVPDDEFDEDADEVVTPSLSLQEKLKAFRDVLQVLKDRNDSDDSALTALRRVQDAIRTEARQETDSSDDAAVNNSDTATSASGTSASSSKNDGTTTLDGSDATTLDFASTEDTAAMSALENIDSLTAPASVAAAEAMLRNVADEEHKLEGDFHAVI